jgi:hypothetical protein
MGHGCWTYRMPPTVSNSPHSNLEKTRLQCARSYLVLCHFKLLVVLVERSIDLGLAFLRPIQAPVLYHEWHPWIRTYWLDPSSHCSVDADARALPHPRAIDHAFLQQKQVATTVHVTQELMAIWMNNRFYLCQNDHSLRNFILYIYPLRLCSGEIQRFLMRLHVTALYKKRNQPTNRREYLQHDYLYIWWHYICSKHNATCRLRKGRSTVHGTHHAWHQLQDGFTCPRVVLSVIRPWICRKQLDSVCIITN